MLRGQVRRQGQGGGQAAASRMQGLVVFSVAGRRLAARTEEIGGVMPWPGATRLPSDTPYVSALVRHDDHCVPVFDLAAKFQRTIADDAPLCLLIKHVDGPMAVCIDGRVPSLHLVPHTAMQDRPGQDPDLAGTCTADGEEIPIIHLTTLGTTAMRSSL